MERVGSRLSPTGLIVTYAADSRDGREERGRGGGREARRWCESITAS